MPCEKLKLEKKYWSIHIKTGEKDINKLKQRN